MTSNNFYLRTTAANNPNEAIEIYIGQNCGKQLSSDILNARSEVLIVSPYVDESKINMLLRLQEAGVNVKLALSDKNPHENLIRKLIVQHTHTDQTAAKRKKTNILLYTILKYAAIALIITGYVLLLKRTFSPKLIALIMAVSGAALVAISSGMVKKSKRIRIHSYSYHPTLPFKYLTDYGDREKFVHSKIYIIDQKIAYVGSVNFTNRGFTSNFETRVRITQVDKIIELREFVNNIFDDDYNYTMHRIDFLGKRAYRDWN